VRPGMGPPQALLRPSQLVRQQFLGPQSALRPGKGPPQVQLWPLLVLRKLQGRPLRSHKVPLRPLLQFQVAESHREDASMQLPDPALQLQDASIQLPDSALRIQDTSMHLPEPACGGQAQRCMHHAFSGQRQLIGWRAAAAARKALRCRGEACTCPERRSECSSGAGDGL